MTNKVSIIIPFLNEEENIPALVESLSVYFSQPRPYNAQVIFVDDGSTDGSVAKLRETAHGLYAWKIISLSRNYGSHAALRAGILHADGCYVCFLYADLQDPLSLIDELYSRCEEGHEVCWATRESTKSGLFERVFSRSYSRLMQKYVIPSYPERGFDVVMFGTKVKKALNQNVESNSSVFLQILVLGFTQTRIGYSKMGRTRGKSKWTVRKKIKLVVDSFIAFSYAPIRFVTLIGILLFFSGLIWTSYIVIRKLAYNDLDSGWPALISLLTIGFGVTNISLGIIAEYLWRTLDATRKRPVFIIDEVIEHENVFPS